MGWKLKKIELCGRNQIKPNEQKDLYIKLEEEKRAAIHGEVKFPSGMPVKGAIVKLFRKKKKHNTFELVPITFTFTDEYGQFLFGVKSTVDYVIKIFYYKPEKPMPMTPEKPVK